MSRDADAANDTDQPAADATRASATAEEPASGYTAVPTEEATLDDSEAPAVPGDGSWTEPTSDDTTTLTEEPASGDATMPAVKPASGVTATPDGPGDQPSPGGTTVPVDEPAPGEPVVHAPRADERRARRRTPGRVLAALAVMGLVAGALGWRVWGPEPGLEVVEVGVAEAMSADEFEPGIELTWGAIVGNGSSQEAVEPVFEVEVLDENGEVLSTYVYRFDHLAPGETSGLGGTTDDEGAVDVRVSPSCTREWRDAGEARETVAIDDVEISTTRTNAAVVSYRATSRYEDPVGKRATVLVFRDAEGRIVSGGGRSFASIAAQQLEPCDTVTEYATGDTVLTDEVASVEVYTYPTPTRSDLC